MARVELGWPGLSQDGQGQGRMARVKSGWLGLSLDGRG